MVDNQLSHRKARPDDLAAIIQLLSDDVLGKNREQSTPVIDTPYLEAFKKIEADPNQYLMVVLLNAEIVGTCHLTIMPSLTFKGSTRLQIEAVRVSDAYRGQKIGEWMMHAAIDFAKSNGIGMLQLTTNVERPRAKQFYERLGFKATHVGMKLYL